MIKSFARQSYVQCAALTIETAFVCFGFILFCFVFLALSWLKMSIRKGDEAQ